MEANTTHMDKQEYIHIEFKPTEDYFALRVKGNGMVHAGIKDRSVVVAHKQRTCEDNDIVILVRKKELYLRRVRNVNGTVLFCTEDGLLNVMIREQDDVVLGKVVRVITDFI